MMRWVTELRAAALAPSPLHETAEDEVHEVENDGTEASARRLAAKDYYASRRENSQKALGLEKAKDYAREVENDDAEAPLGRGQTHYHERHKKEIEDGILSHLMELGLNLKEAAEALMGGQGDNVVAFSETSEFRDLQKQAKNMEQEHLRELLENPQRFQSMSLEAKNCGVFLDWTRQKVSDETMAKLFELAYTMNVPVKIKQMQNGERINTSERRAVLHTALRAWRGDAHPDVSENVARYTSMLEEAVPISDAIKASCEVRDRLLAFVDDVRNGRVRSVRGEPFASVVVVGIGGSYLGPKFITQATAGEKAPAEDGHRVDVRFVANVDPVAFDVATEGLDATKTLAIVVSKSWTTAETLRNAQKVRRWIVDACMEKDSRLSEQKTVRTHFVACASRQASAEVEAWGIDSDTRLFEFWNWVGGRYSSTSSAGVLPLALARGSTAARAFLDGARAMDEHFFSEPLETNVPVVMALLGIWNVNFLGLGARAVVPYSEALARFAAHVQQLEMESHGKSVTIDGRPLDFVTGEIVIGEPGTNAQHSFFQLLHQGQAVPTDFIGFLKPGDATSDLEGHDELMSNFFAQPDALAVGRAFEDVLDDVMVSEEGDLEHCPHMTLSGDRPSLTLLLDKLDAFHVGVLLSLYEHRCAVQGFVWDINSFDQWGVQLGKDLAGDVRANIRGEAGAPRMNPSTSALLERYRVATRDAPP
jgi:glucose-6-phosphate isomerase